MAWLKNSVGGANRCEFPNTTARSSGRATKTATEETILPVTLLGAMCRNKKRSRTRPMSGATSTTAMTKASHVAMPPFTRIVKSSAAVNACAPNPKLKTPVVW